MFTLPSVKSDMLTLAPVVEEASIKLAIVLETTEGVEMVLIVVELLTIEVLLLLLLSVELLKGAVVVDVEKVSGGF